jgi:hypothetical protein
MNPCAIVELRQYTLKPGARDTLIELFEREFVETQEAVDMTLIGQFRDIDRPDRFVWLRGFPDMASRADSLRAFYEGPVWRAHREAANATMIDSDDVLLLKPYGDTRGFALDGLSRAANGEHVDETLRIVATILSLARPLDEPVRRRVTAALDSVDAASGAEPLARFETEYAENTFPRLPVRTGENMVVSFARERDGDGVRAASAQLAAALGDVVATAPESRVLRATPRSLVR